MNVFKSSGSSSHCGCGSAAHGGWPRRDFLKTLGAAAGALAAQPWRAMAGPFTRADFTRLVPEDKKLRPEWVASLTARGERETYRGADLEKIGMPVGGICAGQVYLGGDGRLWHWDIFNAHIRTGAEHYAKPMSATAPLEQGFALRWVAGGQTFERRLDGAHWPEVTFTGEYPIGFVEYRNPQAAVSVSLEAFSPFIPLNAEDSSLPVTVMEFTVRNQGHLPVEAELAGWLENAVCLNSGHTRDGLRRNRLVRKSGCLSLECSAVEPPAADAAARPDIAFDDFEHENYGKWTTAGTAFGAGPVELAKVPSYQGDLAAHGKRAVNSHASAPGDSVERRDAAVGTLTSPPFIIERNFIHFLVGGGGHQEKTCVNLLVGDKVVLSTTGKNSNRMSPVSWDVRPWLGQSARIQAVDDWTGSWGNIGLDDIVFSDSPRRATGALREEPDFGTMGLTLLEAHRGDTGNPDVALDAVFSQGSGQGPSSKPFGQKLVGSLVRKLRLAPGASAKASFLVSWHMPNLGMNKLPPGRHYATRFDSALAVAKYVAAHYDSLNTQTRLWHETWYDSTLPYWFLDRTFLNTSILATSTCYRFGDGRFYGWEGVGCCEGTCGHVWQYAHAVARIFPELERITREKVDFGLALQPDGAIHFRGEFNDIPAIDAQAGTILRALREHQASADGSFLKRNWPAIRRATRWLIAKDANGDGLIESNQHNTLDTDWFGPVAWLSGLYLAALQAAETMAGELNDAEFAAECRNVLEAGRRNIVTQLFEDGYFVNKPDAKHLDAINSGTGCEIDQVFGQSWTFQVGLPRVLPEAETLSALRSLWRYNFTPDVGPYREAYKAGRWYAMPGEAGLLMCTFPRSDWDYAQAKGKGPDWAAGYFNECMNGFEYQVAGHMLWEGMITEGLAVTRALHDRYHPARRNPWNEVECGDHYARSMASYGVYLAACGYEYHGPRGHLRFAPRLQPENFKCAFTSAQGWGSYTQRAESGKFEAELVLKWGCLRLRSLGLTLPVEVVPKSVDVCVNGKRVDVLQSMQGKRLTIEFKKWVTLAAGGTVQMGAA